MLSEEVEDNDSNTNLACVYCEKQFKSQYSLKKHIKIHTGEELSVCQACGKCFRLEQYLKEHMVRKHGRVVWSKQMKKEATSSTSTAPEQNFIEILEQTEIDGEVKIEKEAEVKSQKEAHMKNRNEAEINPETEAQVKTPKEAEINPQNEAQVKTQKEAEINTQNEAKVKTQKAAATSIFGETETFEIGHYKDDGKYEVTKILVAKSVVDQQLLQTNPSSLCVVSNIVSKDTDKVVPNGGGPSTFTATQIKVEPNNGSNQKNLSSSVPVLLMNNHNQPVNVNSATTQSTVTQNWVTSTSFAGTKNPLPQVTKFNATTPKNVQNQPIQIIVVPKTQTNVNPTSQFKPMTLLPKPQESSSILGIQPMVVKSESAVSLLDNKRLAQLKNQAVATNTSHPQGTADLPRLIVTKLPENVGVGKKKCTSDKEGKQQKTSPRGRRKRKMDSKPKKYHRDMNDGIPFD